jgi:hypothetical protein
MAWVAVAVAGSSLVSGAIGANASKKASKAQVAATEKANATEREIFDRQTQLQEPFRQSELAKQAALMQRLGIGGDNGSGAYGDLSSGFMPANYMTELDPGYNFRFDEGMKALDRKMSATGMTDSGAARKAAIRYGQDYASNEFMNAFSRYQTGRNATLNPLMGGSASTNFLSGALGQMGGRIGENQIGAGNAQAAGYVGGANAWNQAISGGVNSYLGYNMFNNMGVAPPSAPAATQFPGGVAPYTSGAMPRFNTPMPTPPSYGG